MASYAAIVQCQHNHKDYYYGGTHLAVIQTRVMKVILYLCACFGLLTSVVADWEDGNDGVDRPNGDLPNQPIVLEASAQPKDCAGLCKANDACKAWAYLKANCEKPKVPWCYLKATITPQRRNTCIVSITLIYTYLFLLKMYYVVASEKKNNIQY